MTTNYGRWLFGSAAAVNVVLAASLLFLRGPLSQPLHLEQVTGTNFVFVNIAGTLVGLFGYVYALIAVNPLRYRVYIPLGIIAKILAVVSTVHPWFSGAISYALPALVAIDVVYAVLFADFLRRLCVSSSTGWVAKR